MNTSINNEYVSIDTARVAAAIRSKERNYRTVYIYYVSPKLTPDGKQLRAGYYKVSTVKYIGHEVYQFVDSVLADYRKKDTHEQEG